MLKSFCKLLSLVLDFNSNSTSNKESICLKTKLMCVAYILKNNSIAFDENLRNFF